VLVDRNVALGVVALLLISGTISALTAPGKFSPDSLDQYNQALTDVYTDWHTPILTGLWGFLNTPPQYVLVLFVTLVMVASMFLLISETPVTWAVVSVTLVCVWPMTFEVLVTIGKDAWFAGFFLAGAALSSLAIRYRGPLRTRAFVAVGALWWLAVAARPNAIIPVFLVVAFGWPLTLGERSARWWSYWWSLRALRRIGLALGYSLLILVSQSVYTSIVVQPEKTHPEQPVYQYDLVGLSLRTGEMLVPASSLRPGTNLAKLREHWSEGEGYGLFFTPDAPVKWAVPPAQVAELRRAWIDAIKDHPIQYLEHRAKFGLIFLGITKPSYGVFLPRTTPAGWGYDYSLPAESAPWFTSWYQRTFLEGGAFCWFRQWMFIVVLVGVGLTRRGRRSIAVRTLLASGIGSTLSFMVAAPAAGFRYAWFTMLCSLLAAAIGLFWLADCLRLRRRSATLESSGLRQAGMAEDCDDLATESYGASRSTSVRNRSVSAIDASFPTS
jgi:hypothetical protein